MTLLRAFILLAFVFAISPAQAGQAQYADMRGKWESTQCKPPTVKPPSDPSSETPADDLNAQVLQHNQFVSQAGAYMECLSSEAAKDSEALAYLVSESAKLLIEDVQGKINKSSFHIQKKKKEDNDSLF